MSSSIPNRPTVYHSTLEAYNQWAETYDTDSNFLQALDTSLLPSLLPSLLASVPAQSVLLDLGCGTGRTTLALLAHPGATVIGLDVSPAMLAIAQVRCEARFAALTMPEKAISWQLGVWDLLQTADDNMPEAIQSRKADAILSTLVLEHIPLAEFFATVSRLLVPGGNLLLTNMHPDMGRLSQAGFVDPRTGCKIRGESFVHGISETVQEATNWGFEVVGEVKEVMVEKGMVDELGRRAEKWVGMKVWFGGMSDAGLLPKTLLSSHLYIYHASVMMLAILATLCLVWYFFILTVCAIGIFQIKRSYSSVPPPSISASLPLPNVPHVTILRPVKGLEPHLYECLAATFRQTYPAEKLTVYLCIASCDDPAYPVLQRLLTDFSTFDAKILVEEEDPNLFGRDGEAHNLGPNPKIRNMSRGYREAKGDIVWIIDCNVWVGQGVAGRMVDLLCGFAPSNLGGKYKFVHQLPLVVDIHPTSSTSSSQLLPTSPSSMPQGGKKTESSQPPFLSYYGGLLEELFLSTAHAKLYTAISAVAIAPCIVGKSNMFRRSHLNALTADTPSRSPGIDPFSDNICEDHLIGDLLWRSPVPQSVRTTAALEGLPPKPSGKDSASGSTSLPLNPQATKWRNHGLLRSDLAIQPMSRLPLSDYLARRVRWLRVRKFTVSLATFVEPGTESILCTLYLAFGATHHPLFQRALNIQPSSWSAFFAIWVFGLLAWMTVDYLVWRRLQSGATIEGDGPAFLKRRRRRRFGEWALAWVGREVLALGIWIWAVVGGVTVVWRGRRFWVGVDMKVHEIGDHSAAADGVARGKLKGKGGGKGT